MRSIICLPDCKIKVIRLLESKRIKQEHCTISIRQLDINDAFIIIKINSASPL